MSPNVNESRIRLLDINTVNQIAAGEVVERPASVVKELVENAIDAEATHIAVKIFDDNIEKIQVADNGYGMVPEDLIRSIQSHATSKIRYADDLKRLHTLGFRGEALPSIAAVSQMTISSRIPGDLSGYLIEVENGKPTIPQETGMPEGTVVLVDKLFYNTPARKKFLKTPTWEMGQISDLMGRLALSHPGIAFSLEHKQKRIFSTSGNGDINQAFLAVYGKDAAKSMVQLEWLQDMLIYGIVSLPEYNRSNRQHYNFFINNRWVRSQELASAIDEAYHTLLPQHRYPVTALYLSLPPEAIDINVHPAKLEVKFRDPKIVRECLMRAVKQALLHQERMVPRLGQPYPQERGMQSGSAIRIDEKGPQSKWVAEKSGINLREPDAGAKLEDTLYGTSEPAMLKRPVIKNYQIDFQKADHLYQEDKPVLNTEQDFPEKEKEATLFSFQSLKLLGQVNASYIVASGEDGVYFIDQHAAHERILYEKYRNEVMKKTAASDMLAVPETLELTYQEKLSLIDQIIALNDMGFILEHFGDNTFILRGVPLWCKGSSGGELIRDLLSQLTASENVKPMNNRDEELFMMACKSAVKAKRYLTDSDIHEIFRNLDQCENPNTCPHGRPVAIKISFTEITRKFLRTSCI